MNSYKIIKEMLFLMNLFFIVGSELMLYVVFNDYSSFIDRITSRLASINILYVKMFQAFALNNSLIDDKTNNKLLKFTDNAPWSSSDINIEDLKAVCDAYNIVLPNGFESPINAGMISLVFKGYEKETCAQIIIKMKRKNTRQHERLRDFIVLSAWNLLQKPIENVNQIAIRLGK
jgi:hypothetical protein